jgi:hypothetical protein
MSLVLKGVARVFRIDIQSWYFALEVGHDYGWLPLAMISTEDAEQVERVPGQEFEWYGDYLQGNQVGALEAQSWAEAFEEALADIPDHDATAHKTGASPMPAIIKRFNRDLGNRFDPKQCVGALEWFSGQRKQMLWDFIAFCRQGGFRIR